ncbi:MAG: hypothetical protein LQ346_007153 [Caloplaca aetnensis]|nr:MAG: hypothetical protein LQ346_007153 [Caloplaca aetnensis]
MTATYAAEDEVIRLSGDADGWLQFSAHDVEHMVEWADLLLVVCLEADTLAKMLHGIADTLLLRVLRSWNVAKKIALMPAMSRLMWENPMTRKQLSKVRRKWNWIRVLGEPLVWDSKESPEEAYEHWTGIQECVDVLDNQIDLLTIGHDIDPAAPMHSRSLDVTQSKTYGLPSELWSLILEQTGDWELARTLGVYTQLPTPTEWQGSSGNGFMHDLERTILLGSMQDIARMFQAHGPPKNLSRLCVKLIIKFARTDILSHLEANFKDLFWSQFGHALLPTKASAIFGQTAVLDWWHRSPSFLTKDYNSDALDLASKSGHVHILQWWRTSGLPLRYTDTALEQASAQGQVDVLEWWRSASFYNHREHSAREDPDQISISMAAADAESTGRNTAELPPLQLKVGKSLIYAAQNGQTAAIRWWMSSGIPTVHEEAVARTASANGHVNILRLWKEIKGEKMQYDNQVLVGPTKLGHVDVLEWWKTSGYRVEYKTCDIEEALEDSVGGQEETRIRSWWARNGLNLGVGTSEWMKVKIL